MYHLANRTVAVRRGFLIALLMAVAITIAPYSGTSHAAKPAAKATLNLANKGFTEEYIVADMYQLLLQKAGFRVVQHNLGETPIVQKALMGGQIDVYPEYTGTGLVVVLKMNAISNAARAYQVVKNQYKKRFNLVWLQQSPMNDTNGVGVTKATAQKNGITTMSSLAKAAPNMTFAGFPACKDRMDCLAGMKQVYGINFKQFIAIESQPVIYSQLTGGKIDAGEVFTTDPQIGAYGLVVPTDDKGLFPADHIAPVVRGSILKKYPQIRMILNRLAPMLTTPVMIGLNGQVALQHKNHMAVARQFLKSHGLL